jgi:hypothetical protein
VSVHPIGQPGAGRRYEVRWREGARQRARRFRPEEPGPYGGALGYSWSSYQAAADDAVAYLQDVEQDHRPAPTGDDDA